MAATLDDRDGFHFGAATVQHGSPPDHRERFRSGGDFFDGSPQGGSTRRAMAQRRAPQARQATGSASGAAMVSTARGLPTSGAATVSATGSTASQATGSTGCGYSSTGATASTIATGSTQATTVHDGPGAPDRRAGSTGGYNDRRDGFDDRDGFYLRRGDGFATGSTASPARQVPFGGHSSMTGATVARRRFYLRRGDGFDPRDGFHYRRGDCFNDGLWVLPRRQVRLPVRRRFRRRAFLQVPLYRGERFGGATASATATGSTSGAATASTTGSAGSTGHGFRFRRRNGLQRCREGLSGRIAVGRSLASAFTTTASTNPGTATFTSLGGAGAWLTWASISSNWLR
jgi:hypothetical protein